MGKIKITIKKKYEQRKTTMTIKNHLKYTTLAVLTLIMGSSVFAKQDNAIIPVNHTHITHPQDELAIIEDMIVGWRPNMMIPYELIHYASYQNSSQLAKTILRSMALRNLGITNYHANRTQVRHAYYALVRIHHPDKGGDAEQCKIINRAYAILLPKPNAGYNDPDYN